MRIIGIKAPGSSESLSHPSLHWMTEDKLTRTYNAQAYVVQDFRVINDLVHVLFNGKPVLYVLQNEVDFIHFNLLLASGDLYLTPLDGILVSRELDYLQYKYGWLWSHVIKDSEEWLNHGYSVNSLPDDLKTFMEISKSEYWGIARESRKHDLGQINHCLKILGGGECLSSVFINRPSCINSDDMSPSLLFLSSGHINNLHNYSFNQSALVISPFILGNDTPIEKYLREFRTVSSAIFLLYNVYILKESGSGTLGYILGEFVI